ncbi:hypothetical protein BDR03DRAFT_1015556 [Suillus americanus]|nr:hypothetical protein BDR03DRAFT_1015556 [Suillus americanus]
MPVSTHPSNINVHPGQIVHNAGQKWCTKAEKAADDKHLHEELTAKEAAAVQGIEHLAKIQATMEESQASMTNKKPKAVRPCPVKKPVVASQKEAGPALDNLNQVEDRSEQESIHEKSTPDVPENVLVDGFDDAEVDELLEHEAAFQSTKRGRMPVKSIIQIFDSLEEISVPPPIQPRKPAHSATPLSSSSDLEDSESDLGDIITDDIDVDDSISTFERSAIKQEPEDVHMEYSRPSAKKKGSRMTSLEPPSKKIKTERVDSWNTPSTSKATEDHTWVERSKAWLAYHNIDLPPPCQDPHWSKIFLPTIFLWAEGQPNLWTIDDESQ